MKLDANCDCCQSGRNPALRTRDDAFSEGKSSYYGAFRPKQAVEGTSLPDFGSPEANEKVAKMMASMGHKPGTLLGKNGEGILRPYTLSFRPANIGLGRIKEPKPFFV